MPIRQKAITVVVMRAEKKNHPKPFNQMKFELNEFSVDLMTHSEYVHTIRYAACVCMCTRIKFVITIIIIILCL